MAFATLAGFALAPSRAAAQAVVTAVNGDPVTTFDVDEHAKLLKVLRRPASHNDALEDAIADRLKYDEARHWGLDASDTDLQTTLNRIAGQLGTTPQALAEAFNRAHVDTDQVREHLRSLSAWNNYVRARNKTIGVSEEEISADIAKGSQATKITDYTLNQVVFVVPVGATLAVIEGRLKEAQGLRARFDDCGTGFQLARSLPEVVVKDATTRASDTLSAAFKKVLDETPSGRLTPPERSQNGIEMVAVCSKNNSSDPTTLRERVQSELTAAKLEAVSEKMFKELRATAVISKN